MSARQRLIVSAVSVLSVLGAVSALGASVGEVISARQQGFKKIGAAFKLIHNELASPSPDAAKIAAAAAEIKASTGLIKTHARAEIWSDTQGFAATRAAFIRQAEKSTRQLSDPAGQAAWKDSSAALGQACKDCHDSYRAKE
jgi:cytochrome c556